MAVENWREVERHLLSVLTLTPAERRTYLEEACGADPDLRRSVEALLALDSRVGDFLETPAVTSELGLGSGEPATLAEGQRLGPYFISRKLGEGGMSTVYLALRDDDQFRRQVAVKVIRHGMDSAEILRRFLGERQILANLNHPGIAQLYDGGTTDDGLPYFAMEYVDGLPIDEFCDAHGLAVEERLDLFLRVCAAVHYAHQNLVVHRDIKPGNILVTRDRVPKLLDFGIAKLLSPRGAFGSSEATVTEMRLMTPSYASPEQARGQAITTASDVYSLGVVLYKLLTGRLPYHFKTGSSQELDQAFHSGSPAKPSQAAGEAVSKTDSEGLSRANGARPSKWRKQLRGDLDGIVLTALRVESEQRYSSVEQLAEDLRRFQAGLAVNARKDTYGYQAMRFLRRNKLTAALALAFLTLLIGFAARATVDSLRVERERQRTERVAEFLIALFDTSAASSIRPETITARELLERGAASVDRGLEEQPEIRATLMDTIGRAYNNLRLFDQAIPQVREALRLRTQTGGGESLQAASSLYHLAVALHGAGDYEASEESFREAWALRRRLQGESSPEVADILEGLAAVRQARGDFQDGVRFLREALEIRHRSPAEAQRKVMHTRALLASILVEVNEFPEAEDLYRQAIPAMRSNLGAHPVLAHALHGLGFLLVRQGDLAAAEPPIRESLEMRRALFGEEHPVFAESLSLLSLLLREQAAYEAAEPLQRQCVEILRSHFGARHPAIVREQYNLALILGQMGAYASAEELYRATLVMARQLVGEDHPRLALNRAGLAAVLHAQGESEEAAALFRQAESTLQQSLGDQHLYLAFVRLEMGVLHSDRREFATAESLLRRALPIVEKVLGEDHWRTGQAWSELGGCLIGQGKWAEAAPYAAAGYRILEATRGDGAPVTRRARARALELGEFSDR